MRLPFSVQVFLLAKQQFNWSVLLLQRNARPELALPDFWQGVSGALETGESFESAAIREMWEETGIRLPSVEPTGFEQSFPIRPEWRKSYGPEPMHVNERVFYAVIKEKISPTLSQEHKAFRWCVEPEAVKLLTFANNAQCAEAVFRSVGRAAA